MKFNAIGISFLIVSLLLSSGVCVAREDPPEVTIEGLQLIKDTDLALVYAEPGIDLRQYKRIFLVDAYIAFKRHWQTNQNRAHPGKVTARDMTRIKADLSALFREVFSTTLEDGGYELVTERAEDVLLIKPAIIDLDVYSPDSSAAANIRSYSKQSGEMTLYLELYDSLTDDLIAKALDRQEDQETAYIRWQNKVTNRAAARRMLQAWADTLKNGLDSTRESTSGQ
jgi:hypothetical protein